MNDYRHPIAVPLAFLAVGLAVTAASLVQLLRGGDVLPAAGLAAGVVLTGFAVWDLARRMQRTPRR
jgi:CHASE2 domain-containing sensor protein